jgi:FixJ family two-component response regulator
MAKSAVRRAPLSVTASGISNLSKVPVISIVDDDKSVREGTRRLIRSLGYATAAFASAEEYLLSDHLQDTSCLITDIKMHGMSGVEMQRRLIADGYRTPIIFMTAFPEEEIRERVLEAGAFGFLSKPVNESCLIGCLDKALKGDGAGPSEQ